MESTSTTIKTAWSVDPAHSEAQFKVKHLVISTVTGHFKKFEGQVISEGEDFENASVSFSVDVNSIDTNQEQRDGHLKSPDFFDAAKYPKIDFQSTSFKKSGDGRFILKGDLTVKDVTRPVRVVAEFGGIMADPYGNMKAGFEVTGSISRKEFGLVWNAMTEAGTIVVSDEVKLIFNIQFVKQGKLN